MVKLEIRAVTPNTNPMFATLDPITFPNDKPGDPLRAACTLTMSSGALVANDTTVNPIIILDRFSFKESPTEDLTKNSPPTISAIKPRNR